MSSKFEPMIWSRYTGQRIPCFDRCQLTITWISNIKVRCYPISWSMANILRDSVTVVIVYTRPRAIPLVMIATGKSIHGFLFLSYMGMGLRFVLLKIRALLKISMLDLRV